MPNKSRKSGNFLRDMLTFEHLVAGKVLHLLYWAGLGITFMFAAGWIGAAIALGMREGTFMGFLLAFPSIVAGLLVAFAMVLVWRLFCEFCNAIFRVSEDLRVMRLSQEADVAKHED